MAQFDRLSALMSRFELTVAPSGVAAANFLILGDTETGDPTCLVLFTGAECRTAQVGAREILVSARVDWGGAENPLMAALPTCIHHDLTADNEMLALAQLLHGEQQAARCGAASVLNRLGEVLIVRLLRAQIETGAVGPGLLGGLADKRLSRAIVAMHDAPGRPWRVGSLAEVAGLSVSRFAELFRAAVGESPSAYLRRWRLLLAKQDIQRGDRIQSVARRYGYGSAEALSRAFRQAYGANPIALRSNGLGPAP